MEGLRRVFQGDIVDHPLVCRVIIVDDGSSESDRLAMAREFPRVDFVLKNNIEHRGHARSMNLLLKLVQTRVEIKFRAPHAIDATCFRSCVCAMTWRFHAIDATSSPWSRRLDGVT